MDFEIAKEKAFKYLVLAKKTEYEVRNKLKKIGCDEVVEEQVVSYLKELKYIDDNDYVDAYIRQCMRLLQYSVYEIQQKLLQKGIKKCIMEIKLENLKQSDYEKNLIEKLKNGKCKSMEALKWKQYLYRRGLLSSHISDD